MSTLQQAIRDRLDSLASDLEELVREEALRLLTDSLSNGTSLRSVPAARGRTTRARRASGSGVSDAAAGRVLRYVQQHPGVRAEAIRAALGLNKAAWVKISSNLLAEKRMTKRGQRRGTLYNAAR
jgi:hypothetical protein